MTNSDRITPDYIFESSWEVCNKVGGIYTVLSTKAKTLQKLFKDKVIFIGPDLWQNVKNPDFVENQTVLAAWKKHAIEKDLLKVRVGRWNIPGKPIAILVDFLPFYDKKDEIYYYMWEKYKINSMVGYGDYDESCMFAYATAKVIESIHNFLHLENQKVIAHLNEWMLGMAALYIHEALPSVSTIFTTHATSIGRSISGNDKPLYDQLINFNGDQMAQELNVEGKHYLEKITAHHVDCFTTVSEITGEEASQLLDKTPDIITPNGFESNFVPKGKSYTSKQQAARKALIRVAQQLIGKNIPENAFLIGTSGRYEYRNKGLDVFVEALNQAKQSQPDRDILAFIIVPAWIKGPRKDLQKRLEKDSTPKSALHDPYYTHELVEKEPDKIINYLRHLDFMNYTDSKVKIIFIPSFMNGDDGIFNIPYYDLLIGLDLTIFPSYYEPWGYTPLESIAFHIPTITTNLAGFGMWAISEDSKSITSGVEVVDRTDNNYFEVAEEIKNIILNYSLTFSAEEIDKAREAAFLLSEKAAWSYFIDYYLEAYDIAIKETELRIKN